MDTKLAEGVHWIGVIDWTVRDFHGYRTERGSTYNAYLVQDEKTAVVDTVKAPFAADLLDNIRTHVDPVNVDYVVCNHAEPDHAGSLPVLMKACPNAALVCDEKCRKALSMHHDTSGWTFKTVASGDRISLGGLTLSFVETPMVHWPESMFTYVPERKLLFSMDAFGQHYASAHRFDDQEPLDVIMQEARTYFANIVMLYDRPIARVMKKASDLEMDIVAPSHGVIWRSHIDRILKAYTAWVEHRAAAKVVVLYDTMWTSTEKMARAIVQGALETDVDVKLHHVRESNLTVIATEILDTATLAVGSPTLNKTLMPSVAAVLTYLKGLSPKGRAGFAFGSYGWAQGGAKAVHDYLEQMNVESLREPLQVQFVPGAEDLETCRQAGRELARKALEISGEA